MVSETCSTPSMPGKGDGPQDQQPLMPSIRGGQPLPFLGKGGGPPPPTPPPPFLSKGVGPPPHPGAIVRSKSAATVLKRSSNMGNWLQLLRGKMEGTNGRNRGGGSMDDALAEFTKKSTYFQQIEEDVRIHEKAIKEIQADLNSFQTKDMDALLKFYKLVDSTLDVLTDESKVLERFEGFPVKKLEAVRMAAVLYKKLNGIRLELQNWKFESPLPQLIDRVEKYFNKIKREIEALERVKDEEEKKLQYHNIHFDFNILVKIKEAMVDVSSSCTELALRERREANATLKDQTVSKPRNQQKKVSAKMLYRIFQFAYKVYTFAGGQDERAERLTKELTAEIEADPLKD